MNRIFFILTAVALLFGAAPSLAQTSSPETVTAPIAVTVYAKAATGYVMQDLGLMASTDPVLQGGVTVTSGKFSFDVWTSVGLSGSGRLGERGFKDEIDLTGAYADTLSTAFCPVTIELSGAYYVLASFKDGKDDIIQLYGDVGCQLKLGGATITPFVRGIQWIGLGTIDNETLMRPGIRFQMPLGGTWSVDGDVSEDFRLTSGGSTVRGQVDLRNDFGNGLSGFIEAKVTQNAPAVFALGFAKTY